MCSMKTDAMKSRLITSTGTGPLSQKKEKLIKHTHPNFTSFAVTRTRASLSRVADFIDELRKQGGALIFEGGTEWGVGWRGALLSSSIAMPTISSAVPSSSSCQEAVIELTFQSGSFNEALGPASTAGTNTHSIHNTVWWVCPTLTTAEMHSITATVPSINHSQLWPGDRTSSLILGAKQQQTESLGSSEFYMYDL